MFGILRATQSVLPAHAAPALGASRQCQFGAGLSSGAVHGSCIRHPSMPVEGQSGLDHEVRQFGIRVTLVEPPYTRTKLDLNAPRAGLRSRL